MAWLTERQEALRRQERQVLDDLRQVLADIGAEKEDQEALRQSLAQLDDFFLLVVVGEFNAGKSALINALLGQPVLEEGVTPTTTQVQVLRYGDEPKAQPLAEGILERWLPVPALRDMSIVDTPGTNAIICEHELLTARFIPRADLVLFVTSADRPFSESERAFMEQIRAWGKNLILVVNKIDLLDRPEDVERVVTFVREQARHHLGLEPPIFPVSAKLALRAKLGEPALAEASRFQALEDYIHRTLDQEERLRLKFLNPLGVGRRLTQKYITRLAQEKASLEEDVELLQRIEDMLRVYQEDMRRNFEARMAEMDNLLLEMESRAQQYFDETIRIARIFDLANKKRIEREFQERVIQDMPQELERRVEGLIDWLVNAELRQWEALLEQVAQQQAKYQGKMIGSATQAPFYARREQLMSDLKRRAQEVLATYDKRREAERLAQGTQAAVAAAAGIGAGAVGLGALVVALASTVAMDITGILAAGVMFTLGLLIIPARRRQASADLHRKVLHLRQTLSDTLRRQFEHEIQRSVERFQEAIAPYTRFVRAEYQRVQDGLERLERIQQELDRLHTLLTTDMP
ncbi:MAG: GTP-binding protein [Chloroflexi bacterium]|nr:GTP-binding protein [Chloroflexota bacterium]